MAIFDAGAVHPADSGGPPPVACGRHALSGDNYLVTNIYSSTIDDRAIGAETTFAMLCNLVKHRRFERETSLRDRCKGTAGTGFSNG